MWVRTIGAGVAVAGLLAAVYLGWALHRLSGEVIRADKQWPRPWPYPDEWLFRWERRLDAEERQGIVARGGPPGLKIEGEIDTMQIRLAGGGIAALIVLAAGSAPVVVWYLRRRRTRLLSGDAADYSEELHPGNCTGPAADPAVSPDPGPVGL